MDANWRISFGVYCVACVVFLASIGGPHWLHHKYESDHQDAGSINYEFDMYSTIWHTCYRLRLNDTRPTYEHEFSEYILDEYFKYNLTVNSTRQCVRTSDGEMPGWIKASMGLGVTGLIIAVTASVVSIFPGISALCQIVAATFMLSCIVIFAVKWDEEKMEGVDVYYHLCFYLAVVALAIFLSNGVFGLFLVRCDVKKRYLESTEVEEEDKKTVKEPDDVKVNREPLPPEVQQGIAEKF